jgi:hypothetical protein
MQVDDFGEPIVEKKSGCSTTVLWILAIVGGLGVLAVVVCCGGGYLLIRNAFSDDPATIRQVTETITEIELPERFPPLFSMKVPFFGVKMVAYGQRQGSGGPMLMIMSFPQSMAGNEEQMHEQMQQQMQKQGHQQKIRLEGESEEETYTIRGQKRTVAINHGVAEDGTKVVEVQTTFTAKGGAPAFFMMIVPEETWDEAELKAILDSTNPGQ